MSADRAQRPVRIPAQTPDEWNESTRALLDTVVTIGSSKPVHLPGVIAHHPTFLGPYLEWAKAIALRGVLPARHNSMLALRTVLACESEFEWGVHVESGMLRSGLSEAEIAAIAVGPDDPSWSPGDAALLRAVDDLAEHHTIGPDTWAQLSADHGPDVLVEICLIVGHYTMLSLLSNTSGVPPLPDWAALGQTRDRS